MPHDESRAAFFLEKNFVIKWEMLYICSRRNNRCISFLP